MRAIKFRAWDKENKEMCIINDLVFMFESENGVMASVIDTGASEPNEYTRMIMPEHLELMQFTGLLDKDGREIYEGDILVFGKTEVHKGNGNFLVQWDNEWAQLTVERFPKEKFMTPDLRQKNCEHYEVIGNIYENPELLTQ
jgi:uncharacterized phage protein (TIGR01671 family)